MDEPAAVPPPIEFSSVSSTYVFRCKYFLRDAHEVQLTLLTYFSSLIRTMKHTVLIIKLLDVNLSTDS